MITQERTSGLADLVTRLRGFPDKLGEKILTQGLKSEIAQPVCDEIKATAPRGKSTEHMADAWHVVEVGPAHVVITPNPKHPHGFLNRFHEFGTRFMPAHPFARPVWDSRSSGLLRRFADWLIPQVERAARR